MGHRNPIWFVGEFHAILNFTLQALCDSAKAETTTQLERLTALVVLSMMLGAPGPEVAVVRHVLAAHAGVVDVARLDRRDALRHNAGLYGHDARIRAYPRTVLVID